MWSPGTILHDWHPFSIDALGLVTLLGAEEVNACIGRLVQSRWLEYMPLLAGFVIAGDRFRSKSPLFQLYNISSGIETTDMSFWFTRWILAQDFEITRSLVYWEIAETPRIWWYYYSTSFIISFCLTGFLVVLAALTKDWYGLANAIAIVVSIIVRSSNLQANRSAIDRAVAQAKPLRGTYRHALQQRGDETQTSTPSTPLDESVNPCGKPWRHEYAKVAIITSDAKVVTMFMPEQLIVPVFVGNPKPLNSRFYYICRMFGWTAFAIHVIALGMTKLVSQMYTVALLIIPTVLLCWKFGCDDSQSFREWVRPSGKYVPESYSCWIGSRLRATVFEWPADVEFTRKKNSPWRRCESTEITKSSDRSTRRQDLYAWLNLTAEEEDSLSKWDLLPHSRNDDTTWSQDYNAKKSLIQASPTDVKATKDALDNDMKNKWTWRSIVSKAKKSGQQISQGTSSQPRANDPLKLRGIVRTNTVLKANGNIV